MQAMGIFKFLKDYLYLAVVDLSFLHIPPEALQSNFLLNPIQATYAPCKILKYAQGIH